MFSSLNNNRESTRQGNTTHSLILKPHNPKTLENTSLTQTLNTHWRHGSHFTSVLSPRYITLIVHPYFISIPNILKYNILKHNVFKDRVSHIEK